MRPESAVEPTRSENIDRDLTALGGFVRCNGLRRTFLDPV